ncbi:MAG: hypothetical protein H0W09_00825 [Solirubrobacterales bacterium]|nr:hypothetical protein [Solirubrobacterales bacterium]
MNPGARTPEELDELLEDAFVVRDGTQLSALFEDCGILALTPAGREVCGSEAIGKAAASLWTRDRTYVAKAPRVLRARDTALLLSEAGIHVARRGRDKEWRLMICVLADGNPITKENQ